MADGGERTAVPRALIVQHVSGSVIQCGRNADVRAEPERRLQTSALRGIWRAGPRRLLIDGDFRSIDDAVVVGIRIAGDALTPVTGRRVPLEKALVAENCLWTDQRQQTVSIAPHRQLNVPPHARPFEN